MGALRNLLDWFSRASRESRDDSDVDHGSGTRLSVGGWSVGLRDGDRDHDGIPDSADSDSGDSGDSDSGDSDGGSDD